MDVCKCIVLTRHWSNRKSSCEVGGRGREVGGPDQPQGFIPLNWGGTEKKCTVTCMVLKAKANDRQRRLRRLVERFRTDSSQPSGYRTELMAGLSRIWVLAPLKTYYVERTKGR
ncbi:hypothetical protein TNCV_707351 [Trichonephila clavipes]|nr:hypothetical protein TNCV_707351 [Trichonephila clavipes]